MEIIQNRAVAAISTPIGRGAISLIRVTGEGAARICSKVFFPKNGKALLDIDHGHSVYGVFKQSADTIDDGMAAVYYSPRSYTGEEMVELCCHGGILVTRLILQALFDAGAYPAKPGEFSKRAFINGKMRLCEAEGVMEIIDAESRAALRLAQSEGRKKLSGEIAELYDGMKLITASIYAFIDYPDEDLADMSSEEMRRGLETIHSRLKRLCDSYSVSRAVSEGIETVICGKPNVGKSSLMNMLTGHDSAIVTEIAGTTRDVISESVTCGDVLLRLCDTAGIHESSDTVELIGVSRAVKKLEECSLALAVFDGIRGLDGEDRELIGRLNGTDCVKIAIINKCDGELNIDKDEIEKTFDNVVYISALTGEGAEELVKKINELFLGGQIDYVSAHVANARQYGEVLEATGAIKDAIDALDEGQSVDIASISVAEAMGALGRVDGRQIGDDVVNEIFGRFCVGK